MLCHKAKMIKIINLKVLKAALVYKNNYSLK